MSVKQMALVWELDLEPNKKIVLLAYADHADDEGNNVFPSLARVAHKTGYSKDQVRRISRGLVQDNLMELVERSTGEGKPHRYKLTLEGGSKLQPFGQKPDPSPIGANDPPGIGAPMPPEPSIEPSVKNSRRDADASPMNWFTEFCNRAKDLGLEVTPEDRKRVPGHLKTIYENGASDVEMHRVLTAMLDARLRNYPMSPQESLNKVRGVPPRRHLAAVGSMIVTNRSDDEYDEAAY